MGHTILVLLVLNYFYEINNNLLLNYIIIQRVVLETISKHLLGTCRNITILRQYITSDRYEDNVVWIRLIIPR